MIGPNPDFAENTKDLTIRGLSDSRFEQVRTFNNGHRQVLTISLDHGGNVLETKRFDEGSHLVSHGTFDWCPITIGSAGAFYLRSYTLMQMRGEVTNSLNRHRPAARLWPWVVAAAVVVSILSSLPCACYGKRWRGG